MSKRPGYYLNPAALIKTAAGGSGSVSVDDGTHLHDLFRLTEVPPDARTLNVPIACSGTARVGDVLFWDQSMAHALFTALARNHDVPSGVLRAPGRG